jgi:hypothetical protein
MYSSAHYAPQSQHHQSYQHHQQYQQQSQPQPRIAVSHNNTMTSKSAKLSSAASNATHWPQLDMIAVNSLVRDLMYVLQYTNKTFCEEVIKRSASTLSYLFNNTRPWSELSEERKEGFHKMNDWCKSEKCSPVVVRIRQIRAQDKLTQKLDTAEISQYIRNLICIHDIDHTLFASYVLNKPSAACLAEILSKDPKPWDELSTEQKDMYNKMNEWYELIKYSLFLFTLKIIYFNYFFSFKKGQCLSRMFMR